MAAAGDILVRTMNLLAGKIRPGVSTLELDQAAEKFIRSQGAEPAFKGYRGFPGSICASPNSMIVHGIPGSYSLSRGDIISIDIGVVRDGWVADAARTFPVGPSSPIARKLLSVTEESLFLAVEQCRPGNRLGDVSHAVQKHVEAAGLSIVRSLVGHGVGRSCTRSLRCPTTAPLGPVSRWKKGWSWPSSPWSRPGATASGWARITGRSTPRTARWPPISSSRWGSRPRAHGS